MQLIFVMESNKESQSDYYYIKDVLKKYYNIAGYKLTDIYMNGKGNFSKKKKEIDKSTAKYKGKSLVFLCYDVDNESKETFYLNERIEEYAGNNGYKTIWFNEDIEQVFLNKCISKNEKKEEAKKFALNNFIDKIDCNKLMYCKIYKRNTSNIMNVLDKYLKRKNN